MNEQQGLFLDRNISKFALAKERVDVLLEGERSQEEQLYLITNCMIILIALLRSKRGDGYAAYFMKVGMQMIKRGEPLLVKRNFIKGDVL